MKKIIYTLFLLLTCIVAEAKVIKVTMTDGSVKVFTSSELSAIDFNDNGSITITTYDDITRRDNYLRAMFVQCLN